jgi:hypothetical protein
VDLIELHLMFFIPHLEVDFVREHQS